MRFEQALAKGENLTVRQGVASLQLCAHRLKLIEFLWGRQIGCIGDIIGGAGKGVKRHHMAARPRWQQFGGDGKVFVVRPFCYLTRQSDTSVRKAFDFLTQNIEQAGNGTAVGANDGGELLALRLAHGDAFDIDVDDLVDVGIIAHPPINADRFAARGAVDFRKNQRVLTRIACHNAKSTDPNAPRQIVVSLMDEGVYGADLRAAGVELFCLGKEDFE